jgi:hypothetical protein
MIFNALYRWIWSVYPDRSAGGQPPGAVETLEDAVQLAGRDSGTVVADLNHDGVTGAAAGLWPALRAARLSPTKALWSL